MSHVSAQDRSVPAASTPPASSNLTQCVESLYDAVGDDQRFRSALGGFCAHFDAAGAIYLLPPSEQGADTVATEVVPPALLTEYQSHFFAHDSWRLAGQAQGLVVPGFVARGCDLVDPEVLRLSYFWREFLVPCQTKDVLTGVIPPPEPDGQHCAFVSFLRSHAQPGWFDQALVQRLREVLPDLGRALRLHRRLAPQVALAHTLEGMFEQLEVPMLFLDRRGQLLRANRQALAACQTAQALRCTAAGSLMARTYLGWQPLSRLMAGLDQAPTVRHMLVGDGDMPVALTLRQVHGPAPALLAGTDDDTVHAVATLRAAPADVLASLARHYGLTPAEVRVARQVLDGLPAERIAELSGIKVSTVRTHIGHLLAKTGARRQTELVARLRGAAAGISA